VAYFNTLVVCFFVIDSRCGMDFGLGALLLVRWDSEFTIFRIFLFTALNVTTGRNSY